MELWIRSQDKETLLRIDKPLMYWESIDNIHTHSIIFKESPSYIITLGIYNTKERALEVLDGIQNIIKIKFALQCDKEIAFNGIPEKDINYLLHQCAVFDMPQE